MRFLLYFVGSCKLVNDLLHHTQHLCHTFQDKGLGICFEHTFYFVRNHREQRILIDILCMDLLGS